MSTLPSESRSRPSDAFFQLYRDDPINSTLLTAFLRQKLEEGRNNAPGGPPAFDAAMQQADQLVVNQFLEATAR